MREPPVSSARLPVSWSTTLWVVAGVQFIMGMSTTVQSPIVPLFLPELGVAPGGPIEFWSGVLASINFLVAAVASPFWGAMADRRGRKMMVIRSSLAICVFMGLMGLSQTLWHMVVLRGLMGLFSGFSAAAIALIATQVPENRLGYALGWLSTSQLVGALLGPVIGGLVADLSGSYRIAFFCTSALAAVAALTTLLGVSERFTPTKNTSKPSPWRGFQILWSTAGLLPLFFVLLFAQFGVRTIQPVITLFVQDLIGPVAALATLAGFAFSITGLADVLFSPFLGKRSDTLGYRRVLLISLLGAALVSIPQSLVTEYWQFLALRFGAGVFLGGLLPTAHALVARLVSPAQRGLAFGITASATFLGSFLGPIVGGTVAATVGIRAVFLIAGFFFLVNFVWVYLVVPAVVPARADEAVTPDAGRDGLIADDPLLSDDEDNLVELGPRSQDGFPAGSAASRTGPSPKDAA